VAGLDRHTGRSVGGWEHLLQSLEVIFTTRFGERVRREWFGSDIPNMLGRLANVGTFVNFYSAVCRSLSVVEINGIAREPRFQIIKFKVKTVDRLGHAEIEMEGIYKPRALFGDFTPEGLRSITLKSDNVRIYAQ